jgi:hypothetical protein
LGRSNANNLPEKHLVYGICGDVVPTLVFIPRARAVELALVWRAIRTSKTWREFREKMPRDIYLVRMKASFDENGKRRPAGGDKFDYDAISDEDEWPSNPMDDMEEFLPAPVAAFHRPFKYRDFFTIDPVHEAQVLRLLRTDGWYVRRSNRLVTRACGDWKT